MKHGLIGRYFKSARRNLELTQEDVAQALGYSSKQIVSNWERGLCSPPMHQLKKLVRLYKLDRKVVMDLFISEYSEELKKFI